MPPSLKTSLSPHFGAPSEEGTSFTNVIVTKNLCAPLTPTSFGALAILQVKQLLKDKI